MSKASAVIIAAAAALCASLTAHAQTPPLSGGSGGTPATAASNAAAPQPASVNGQLILQFKADANDAEVARTLNAHGLRVRKQVRTGPMQARGQRGFHVVETDEPVDQAIGKLKQEPSVEFAEPNWIYTHQATINDPYFTGGYLWGMYGDNTAPASTYGSQALKAWNAGYTGSNSVYVGIIDEGIQWQHPDLVNNIWTNPFEADDGNDNDANGYADDIHGWDFFSGSNTVYVAGADDHGTHVAGTIGASGANAAGVVGVNWHVTIISGKFMGPNGGTTAAAVEAIDYMVDLKQRHGLNIVALNNSWGGTGYSQALHDAIIRAAKANIVFVAAAGNGDSTGRGLNNDVTATYPADYDTTQGTTTESAASFNAVIAVAAIDSSGNLATFSNYGATKVHLGAPGVNIWSTVPTSTYASYNGTSMATPHVTGAVALYASTHPAAGASEIRSAILGAVTPTPSLAGKTTTGGRLNLSSIIAPATMPTATTNSTAPVLASARVVTNLFRFTVTGPTNGTFDIQMSTNLTAWTTVLTVTNQTGTMTLSEQQPPTTAPRRFYRAIAR